MKPWLAVTLLIFALLALQYAPRAFATNCPTHTYGTNNKTLIKYFSSPLCIACWSQKSLIEHLASTHGNRFLLEEYDADLCKESAAPHVILGVPAFIINDTVIYGAQNEEQLLMVIT